MPENTDDTVFEGVALSPTLRVVLSAMSAVRGRPKLLRSTFERTYNYIQEAFLIGTCDTHGTPVFARTAYIGQRSVFIFACVHISHTVTIWPDVCPHEEHWPGLRRERQFSMLFAWYSRLLEKLNPRYHSSNNTTAGGGCGRRHSV